MENTDLSVHTAFSKIYENAGMMDFAEVRLGKGRYGFVAEMKEYVRAIEVFQQSAATEGPLYASLGPHTLFQDKPSDILSVEPFDWDNDGRQEFLLSINDRLLVMAPSD